MASKGTVYLLGSWGDDGIYKIGVTRGKIENRIKKLQTGNSNEIYLVDKFETEYPFLIESMMHNRYHMDNEMNEWYHLSAEDVKNFRKDCEEYEKTIECLKEDNVFFQKKLKKK